MKVCPYSRDLYAKIWAKGKGYLLPLIFFLSEKRKVNTIVEWKGKRHFKFLCSFSQVRSSDLFSSTAKTEETHKLSTWGFNFLKLLSEYFYTGAWGFCEITFFLFIIWLYIHDIFRYYRCIRIGAFIFIYNLNYYRILLS